MQDWYPNAPRDPYPETGRVYDTSYPWRGVLHSTEGKTWPAYNDSAPHFTIDPRNGIVHQHYRISYPAMSLVQPSVGPATNKGRAIQIEIIGTCDPARRGQSGWGYLPELPADKLVGLPELMRWIEAQTGMPSATDVEWLAYPGSYGSNGVRMDAGTWRSYSGWCGHQHVTGNSHGDPGDIDISGLLAAGGEDDVSAEDVWTYPWGRSGLTAMTAIDGLDTNAAKQTWQQKPWSSDDPANAAVALQRSYGWLQQMVQDMEEIKADIDELKRALTE